ncbi:MAG: helix-turn-helix transcriptional regulator [Oscillospiraceae bacterium]|nr:helix-turn-helix transcriptional regulator [Oscillospiraceae bacterium]
MGKKKDTNIGKWDNLRKTISFTEEEEEEMQQEMLIIQKIIDKRKSKNLTQAELSRKSGVKQPVIARIEKGVNSPQLNTLIKILNALDCKIKI